DLSATLRDINDRLEVSGLTEALGTLFLEEQRRVRTRGGLNRELQALERGLAQSQQRRIGFRAMLPAGPRGGTVLVDDPGRAALDDLQRRVADTLVQGEDQLIAQLERSDERLRAAIGVRDELERILGETLLWWPSHVAVSMEWLKRTPAALFALLDPTAWQTTGAALREVVVDRPYPSLL